MDWAGFSLLRRVGGAAIFALALSVPVIAAHADSARALTAQERALYVLNRLGYGPRPGDIARVTAMGVEAYIDQQLAPERIPENPDLMKELAQLATLHMNPVELFRAYGPPRPAPDGKRDPAALKQARQRAIIIVRELIAARISRALASNRQLQEAMTEFWFNHFNIFAAKGLDYLWIGSFEESAIRPHVLGGFRDLLEATAKHPAMLFYLDNWLNVAPAENKGINENYAREVMELHTLGVDGGYTQADVVSLAHIFTGWSFPRPALARQMPVDPSAFFFDAAHHDYSDKVFLGHAINGSGEAEGEAALDLLARSPATAHHIAFELVQYFVSDKPDPGLVDTVAKRFLKTDGNIAETLRALFHDPRFWAGARRPRQFKTPYQYVISALRLAGVAVAEPANLEGPLGLMGMPLYRYQTPEGYKFTREAWLNSDAMAKRIEFAMRLGEGRVPGQENPLAALARPVPAAEMTVEKIVPLRVEDLESAFGVPLSVHTEAAIAQAPERLRGALFLASPDFMQR